MVFGQVISGFCKEHKSYFPDFLLLIAVLCIPDKQGYNFRAVTIISVLVVQLDNLLQGKFFFPDTSVVISILQKDVGCLSCKIFNR